MLPPLVWWDKLSLSASSGANMFATTYFSLTSKLYSAILYDKLYSSVSVIISFAFLVNRSSRVRIKIATWPLNLFWIHSGNTVIILCVHYCTINHISSVVNLQLHLHIHTHGQHTQKRLKSTHTPPFTSKSVIIWFYNYAWCMFGCNLPAQG